VSVPLKLIQKGDRASVQNEIWLEESVVRRQMSVVINSRRIPFMTALFPSFRRAKPASACVRERDRGEMEISRKVDHGFSFILTVGEQRDRAKTQLCHSLMSGDALANGARARKRASKAPGAHATWLRAAALPGLKI
jgi:hypothetical protein